MQLKQEIYTGIKAALDKGLLKITCEFLLVLANG